MHTLFSKTNLRALLDAQLHALKAEVEKLEADYVLKVSDSDLSEYFVSRYTIDSPRLLIDNAYQHEPQDCDIEELNPSSFINVRDGFGSRSQHRSVRGTAVRISVPFEGEPKLFEYQPSTYTLNPPEAEVGDSEIHMTYRFIKPDVKLLKSRYESTLKAIQEYLSRVQNDVGAYNESLPQEIRNLITARKTKVLADRKLSAEIGIPIRRRNDAPLTYTVPEVKRKTEISRPRVQTEEPFELEPSLDMGEYENILGIIRSMTKVIERSPKAFSSMSEEDLRQQFLVQLNGHYEGQATGETFNFEGKTDILIRSGDRNIFIAECKFWTGPRGLSDTIDQLLSYTTWRDTKTAILLFSRNKDFSSVLSKIPQTVKQHSCFKREIAVAEETTFRYVFGRPDDTNRELHLTVLAFDVPQLGTEWDKP